MNGEDADRIYGERAQAVVETQIKVILFHMNQLNNIAKSKKAKPASNTSLKIFLINLSRHRASDDVIRQCSERLSESNMFMSYILKQFECSSFLVTAGGRPRWEVCTLNYPKTSSDAALS